MLSQGELSFQEVGGLDSRGMALDVLFSGFQLTFSLKTAVKALDCDLGFV